MSVITCNTVDSSINEYTGASKLWNKVRIHHLYNRLGFGASLQEIQAGLNKTPAQLADELIDEAITAAPSYQDLYDRTLLSIEGTEHFNHHGAWYRCFTDLQRWIFDESVRAKMVLFWSGHLVVDVYQSGPPLSILEYNYTLHKYALGNFKDFVIEMGLTHAMLNYLDGGKSTVGSPNQNYPRELLELFTMGITDKYGNNNYTQNDVEEVGRIMTGWYYHISETLGERAFNAGCHDWGTKTMMGFSVTSPTPTIPPPNACIHGNVHIETADPTDSPPTYMAAAYEEYVDFHNQLFTVKANEIAWFICKKMYQYFISHDIDSAGETVIDVLAQTFINSNWEIAPVVRQLFKSEHFFEEKYIGAHIKNPIEFFASLPRKANLGYDASNSATSLFHYSIVGSASTVGQTLLRPPDVSGWDEHHSWITQYSLAIRWSRYDYILSHFGGDIPEILRQLAEDLTLAINNDTNDLKEPDKVVIALADHFFTIQLQEKQIGKALAVLRGSTPPAYFTGGAWSVTGIGYFDKPQVRQQIIDVLIFFTRQPEFNLS